MAIDGVHCTTVHIVFSKDGTAPQRHSMSFILKLRSSLLLDCNLMTSDLLKLERSNHFSNGAAPVVTN